MAGKPGCGLLALILIVAFMFLFVLGNEGVGMYFSRCGDDDANIPECLMEDLEAELDAEAEEGSVVASGVYEYKGHSVNVTMTVPLKGGAVTGALSGTCDGKVTGNYDGKQGGAIGGKMSGACAPFFVNIPAGADYSGSVNKTGKTVSIGFTGRGGGFTHEGSMTLAYP